MDGDTESKDFAINEEDNFFSANTTSPDEDAHPRTNYRRLVTPDGAAFRYLEEDPSTTVLERRRRLQGYELYFVEQWTCSRVHPTYTITTYTGQEHHSIVVGVLSLPTDESSWSPRLRVYLTAITKYHARKRETPLGTLMVTNLSGFPSALTVIPVPGGDLRMNREPFVVAEDLKRLGCSGRMGLNLSPPTAATQTKFYQTYHTSDAIPIMSAVIELVKLCQAALMLFDKLAMEYVDGLLCDVTETAINEWWSDIGSDMFNVDPTDGILGPTTVTAMLGLLMGARKRLSAYGAPVSKDVFDLPNTKRAISYFQKSQKMEKTRRLDKQTLFRLHKVTAKAASSDGWAVPRAVKSTVAELSGKGGELVNGRERGAIAELETLSIENFVHLGTGDRFKWLWQGKPKKNTDMELFDNLVGEDGWVFDDNDRGGYRWSNKRRDSGDDDRSSRHNMSDHFYLNHTHGSQVSMDHADKDSVLRKAVLKNVTGRVTDARSGFGKIKSAVGLGGTKNHPRKKSMDGSMERGGETPARESSEFIDLPSDTSHLERTPDHSRRASMAGSEESSRHTGLSSHRTSADYLETPAIDPASGEPRSDYLEMVHHASGITQRARDHEDMEQIERRKKLMNDSLAIKKMEHFDWASSQLIPLRAARSLPNLRENRSHAFWERRWPRRMSFTAMEDTLSAAQHQPLTSEDHDLVLNSPDAALAFEQSLANQNRGMEFGLQHIKMIEVPWIEAKIAQIEAYDQQCGRDQTKLDMVHHHKTEENHALKEASEELLHQERTALTEANKDIETLGAKLEYELSALQDKIEDVEDGVDDFERQISLLEARVREQLLGETGNGGGSGKKDGWFWWL